MAVPSREGGEETLVRATGVNYGPTINRTVLALILRADVTRRDWQRIPTFTAARTVRRWGVFGAPDFTANGLVKAGGGWRVRRHSRIGESGMNYIPR